ncbi:MAG TPA: exonuclease domain-containing protein [bacterium]|mgnify:CR=1 FL=1|nr:exonuclease domain-containing protein [bacterium]
MNTIYASFDIESTGTDPRRDAIIEIGIVRFTSDGEILRTYSTLVRPTGALPPEIAEITGITESMLASAPRIDSLRTAVMEELADAVLVGHNIEFDLAFMEAAGISLAGRTAIDTFAMAKFLAWNESSLNLGHLVRSFGLEAGEFHRAADDALATARLFCSFVSRLRALDPLRSGILRTLSDRSPKNTLFSHVEEEFLPANESGPATWNDCKDAIVSAIRARTAVEPVDEETPRPEISVDAILSAMAETATENGRTMEPRPEQRRMINTVADALRQRKNTVIEAPTGIGKTFAYLLPTLSRSLPRRERVVVSTHTKLLQDQLLDRDLPFLRDSLERAGVPKSSWRVAKLK